MTKTKMIPYGTEGKLCPAPELTGAEIDKMLWEAFLAKKYAVKDRPYVSIYPVCPPPGYPDPSPPLFTIFDKLPQSRGADGFFPEEREQRVQRITAKAE